ncbi:MAG TPA: putative toxin-antitoxin system toxin component, PIN family [Rugosibacter sp.]
MILDLSAQTAGACANQPAASATCKPLRVVLDTNVLVSLYVFADSHFAPLRDCIESGLWCALSSDTCLAEFERVLAYPQFGLTCIAQQAAYGHYVQYVSLVSALPTPEKAASTVTLPHCTDPDDQKFLEAARDGSADWLVTSDKALLVLARRNRLCTLFQILTPEAALTTLATLAMR